MFKRKLIVKLFKLTDISKMLKQSKEEQKRLDEKYWKEKLQDNIDSLKREHALELQEKDAHISMLEDKVKSYKSKEKELDNKEYYLKKELKENTFLATKIAMKVEEFGMKIIDIVGEMKGIRDEAENNKKRIEQK